MRAVLDSSVLVSIFLTPHGRAAALLHAAKDGAFTLCLSPEILAETAGVLSRPEHQERYGYGVAAVAEYCRGLLVGAELVTELPELHAVPDDPKDNMVVATAVKAGADYLVTGDCEHLLPLREHQGIPIVTPRE